jgi:putative FmdB family regulatory protein
MRGCGIIIPFLIKCFAEPFADGVATGTMPIYEYRCASCGHELEALQKLSDAPLTECPACHKPDLQKLVSAAGFQLKGSGWYVTDFRNSGGKPAATGTAAGKAANAAGASAGAAGAGSGTSTTTEGKSGESKAGTGGAPASGTTPGTTSGSDGT